MIIKTQVVRDELWVSLVTADGLVASVDEDQIIVAGLVAGREAAEWGALEITLDGFTCVYAKADQGKAAQLRTEDSITVTGKISGWETVWGTNARLQDCKFTSTGTGASTTVAPKEYDDSGAEPVDID